MFSRLTYMEELLKYSWDAFYTDLISFSLAFVGLIISIWRSKQNPKLKPLIFFFLGYVLDIFINRFTYKNKNWFPQSYTINIFTDFIDTIVEFLAFFFLIRNHIVRIKIKKAVNPLLPVFLSLVFICLIYYKISGKGFRHHFLQTTYIIQAILLIIACILYYIDLFKNEPKLNLTALPSFWAITGLSFFMLCTLPYSVFSMYLIKADFVLYNNLFSIFDIFYCLLFLMIIKAYLCRRVTVQ